MSDSINDGGPAHPVPVPCEGEWLDKECKNWNPHHGMSLRDYFAGQALPAIITADITQLMHDVAAGKLAVWESGIEGLEETQATQAYVIADAMLAARARPTAKPSIHAVMLEALEMLVQLAPNDHAEVDGYERSIWYGAKEAVKRAKEEIQS